MLFFTLGDLLESWLAGFSEILQPLLWIMGELYSRLGQMHRDWISLFSTNKSYFAELF